MAAWRAYAESEISPRLLRSGNQSTLRIIRDWALLVIAALASFINFLQLGHFAEVNSAAGIDFLTFWAVILIPVAAFAAYFMGNLSYCRNIARFLTLIGAGLYTAAVLAWIQDAAALGTPHLKYRSTYLYVTNLQGIHADAWFSLALCGGLLQLAVEFRLRDTMSKLSSTEPEGSAKPLGRYLLPRPLARNKSASRVRKGVIRCGLPSAVIVTALWLQYLEGAIKNSYHSPFLLTTASSACVWVGAFLWLSPCPAWIWIGKKILGFVAIVWAGTIGALYGAYYDLFFKVNGNNLIGRGKANWEPFTRLAFLIGAGIALGVIAYCCYKYERLRFNSQRRAGIIAGILKWLHDRWNPVSIKLHGRGRDPLTR